ncbi:hypothetical protein KPL70_016019 [Citrus sinensis]|uniref:uncharacterized protein LOC102627343 isoform X1 n=1 Tax=Citrus sinensis TaxID=2711 RepID=UPI00218E194E|nr:uncharacterized protein LOC102627343 isoform X1 [Citrus sinensis]KAH9691156.1 hypothetical protein KPL70_016019 [Citrus sinensis]
MDLANKLTNLAIKAINSNTVVNTCLIASFAALTLRSVKQQNDIEGLESEKESIVKANKDLKKRMWDWKQQLYAEATTESALVPLARLKAIYGDVPTPTPHAAGEAVKEDAKSSATKLVI